MTRLRDLAISTGFFSGGMILALVIAGLISIVGSL